MPAGYQAVQTSHSIADFAIEFPTIFREWHEKSNYIIQLSVNDIVDLQKLINKLELNNIRFTAFYEPDIDNQLTAICIEPTEQARKITSSISLMLKELNQKVLAY